MKKRFKEKEPNSIFYYHYELILPLIFCDSKIVMACNEISVFDLYQATEEFANSF